ncbi:MAG: hypothetical protein WCT04_01660 [Planctomycetota bacterium]
MKFLSTRRTALVVATLLGLTATVFSARAALVNPDFQIGPDAPVDSLSVAAGGTNYLVVWRDLSGGSNAAQISGSIVSSTGVASASFQISNPNAIPQSGPVQRVRVSFNGANYLVVWHDLLANGTGVRGALVSPQGTIVNSSDFLIAPTTNTSNINPQVCFSGGNCLVAWQDVPLSGTGTQIYFTSVSITGVIDTIHSVPASNANTVAQKLEFLVPGESGENLLVYQDTDSTPNASYAVRIEADNSISGPSVGTKMFTNDLTPSGAGAPIGGAYFKDSQEYMLLASQGTQITCSVSRAWLKPDGRVLLSTAPFALVGQGSTGLDENNFPLAVFNGSFEFLFLRNSKVSDVSYHIFMKRVNINGTDNDLNMAVVDEASSGILNGATAAAIGTTYLTVWMDGRRRVNDPPKQTNIYAALIDSTQAGNSLRPYLRPGAFVGPSVGIAPLTTSFGPGSSTGLYDTIQWEFGDGSATSDLLSTTHKYTNAGSYTAVFSLIKSGLRYNQFFNIGVETSRVGGAGGPPQSVGGVTGDISSGINTKLILGSFSATLNFVKSSADTFRIGGRFDITRQPIYVKGQTVTAKIGTNSYTFNLLSDGTFFSTTGAKPFLVFQLDPFTGSFSLTGTSDQLLSALSGTGVSNTTASKLNVSIPISFSFAGLTTTETLQAQYTATVGVSGKINYALGSAGFPGDGYFGVTAGFSTEKLANGKTGPMVHDFAAGGNLTLPAGKTLTKASSGVWRLTFGNYSEDVPVASITLSGTVYSYAPKRVKSGITSFQYNQKTGGFVFYLKGIPATGETPSGMAISTSQVTRADMAVSVDLDLDGNTKVKAGSFLRLFRKDNSKLRWSLR